MTPSASSSKWTPARGIARGVAIGSIVATVLALILGGVASVAPLLIIQALVRVPIGFVVAYVLFSTVHSAAGMVGWACTLIAVVLSVAVLFSNHVVFALNGIPTTAGQSATGWAAWFHPAVLALVNLFGFVGIAGCALLSHGGVPGPDLIGGILSQPVGGRTRS